MSGAVGHAEVAVGHAVRLVEERLAVLRDQHDAGKELSGRRSADRSASGRGGDLGVRALARLGGGAGPLATARTCRPRIPKSGGRSSIIADLEPLPGLLRAREELDLRRLRRQHLLEGERPDLPRHPAEALDALLEGDLLLCRGREVGRDEGADGLGRAGLEGRDAAPRSRRPCGVSGGEGPGGARQAASRRKKDRAAASADFERCIMPRSTRGPPGGFAFPRLGLELCQDVRRSASSGPGRSSWRGPCCSSRSAPFLSPVVASASPRLS